MDIDAQREEKWLKEGVEQFRTGKLMEAIKCFDKSIEVNSPNMYALIMRARTKERLEDFDGAFNDLSAAIEIFPNRPEPYINRGNIHFNIQNWESAIEDYEKYNKLAELEHQEAVVANLVLAKEKLKTPKVFISYSWDNDSHVEWVLKLASQLTYNGVDVLFDKWDIAKFGKPLPNFMEQSISKAQRVICVMTPNYKKKTDKLVGGVGYEYSIITSEIFSNIGTSKFIPIIREGIDSESIPIALRGRNYCDMRNDKEFDEKLRDLLRDIFNEKKHPKPRIGKKPTL